MRFIIRVLMKHWTNFIKTYQHSNEFHQVHDIICYDKWVWNNKLLVEHRETSFEGRVWCINFFRCFEIASISWLRGKNVNENNIFFYFSRSLEKIDTECRTKTEHTYILIHSHKNNNSSDDDDIMNVIWAHKKHLTRCVSSYYQCVLKTPTHENSLQRKAHFLCRKHKWSDSFNIFERE